MKDAIQYRKRSLKERTMKEPTPEFSYIVDLNRIPVSGMKLDLRADAEQCKALADRFDLPAIYELSAHLSFKRVNSGRVRLEAAFKAEIEQVCVVSLEPFAQKVEDSFSMVFVQENASSLRLNEIDLDMGEEDEAEYPENGKIDAGEIVAESLSLALDPFPRAPGAVFRQNAEKAAKEDKNPFAVLEKLKFK